jgi:hypothetical protein
LAFRKNMHTIDYLLKNSNLPGPRGNLELLYAFARNADAAAVKKCLSYIKPETANSPHEFVGMCGVLGYAVLNKSKNKEALDFIRPYAAHTSWRIRESVAMAIQEMSKDQLDVTLTHLQSWIFGNDYEKRAVVAGLCEPKLLGDKLSNRKILKIMQAITATLDHNHKLNASEASLRKALGYGWSVVIVATPDDGRKIFEKLFDSRSKHILWIIRENLKKNRLFKMDADWVEKCKNRL